MNNEVFFFTLKFFLIYTLFTFFIFSTFILFKHAFIATFYCLRFILTYAMCTYIYVLYSSPHCLGCARNDVDIYTE